MQGIDTARVSSWLESNIAGAISPFDFALIAGGRSNLTYAVTDGGGRRFVLRRPPLSQVLATAHDMTREHRIISAVGRTIVPVPKALGVCTDSEVNGAPFYVMSFVDGVVLDSPERAAALPVALRPQVSEHMIDVLADLHAVDVDEVGLGDLAKRAAYITAQVMIVLAAAGVYSWLLTTSGAGPAITSIFKHWDLHPWLLLLMINVVLLLIGFRLARSTK